MRFRIPDVRIADVETCDFSRLAEVGTDELLRRARPDDWEQCRESSVMRRLLGELGVERRYLTDPPGQPRGPGRRTAMDLARSAVAQMRARRGAELDTLDALIFVSTSNPHPCNSQAAMLAGQFGWDASCYDLKAGCSSGVLGILQAALLIQGGATRVLVVMAENLSHFAPPDDLRMQLTTGDGAACLLVERARGPGFLSLIHGSAPAFAQAMVVAEPFPPTHAAAQYTYAFHDTVRTRAAVHARWRDLFGESLAAAGIGQQTLARCYFHQTHRAQVHGLIEDLGLDAQRVPEVVTRFGNMGTPTFAVAMAQDFATLHPGDRYLMQAVGGGMSWCSIVAEHA